MQHLTALLLISLSLSGCSHLTSTDFTAHCNRHSDIDCAMSALEQTENQLADIYQQVADTQEEEGVKRLALAQRNWFKFRDSYAEFVSQREMDSHKAQSVLINQKIDSTSMHINELALLKQ